MARIAEQTRAWAEARRLGLLFTQTILDEITLELRVLLIAEPIFISVADA